MELVEEVLLKVEGGFPWKVATTGKQTINTITRCNYRLTRSISLSVLLTESFKAKILNYVCYVSGKSTGKNIAVEFNGGSRISHKGAPTLERVRQSII